ncbi:MAG: hypothetical protein R2710_25355 [Acidimicrobiales bacterium]
MVRTFGAPVIDAGGKLAANTSGSVAEDVAVTVEVRCITVG